MGMIAFSKWEGTGNDFVLVDDRSGALSALSTRVVQRVCDRHFGIGSDGLILLQQPRVEGTAYHMEFMNPDGSRSFCGNGSRCAYAFWRSLNEGVGHDLVRFTAIDGTHTAASREGLVEIGMRDVAVVERVNERTDMVHTGSPHLVLWVQDPASIDIVKEARIHRYGPRFAQEGINVNFVRWHEGHLDMRTYERGVEDETLSCGTGVTAAALSAMERGCSGDECAVRTKGGDLHVHAQAMNGGYRNISLRGPVREVFTGTFPL